MKTLEQALEYKMKAVDGRDMNRLINFVPEPLLPTLDVTLKPEFVGKHEAISWTRENILTQLAKDVAFGFEKALDQRGISSDCMYTVVQMWNGMLENELAGFDDYAYYGLPLFKATAVLYGFPNPIGDDTGSEEKYGE